MVENLEIDEDDNIIKPLKRVKLLNTVFNNSTLIRHRKLPKSVILNQLWDIIAQPVFKEEFRELKYSNILEKEEFKKNKKKRAIYKKKATNKRNCF